MLNVGVAIVINMGTNLIFGEICFITNTTGAILQLACSMDYAIFLRSRTIWESGPVISEAP